MVDTYGHWLTHVDPKKWEDSTEHKQVSLSVYHSLPPFGHRSDVTAVCHIHSVASVLATENQEVHWQLKTEGFSTSRGAKQLAVHVLLHVFSKPDGPGTKKILASGVTIHGSLGGATSERN